MALRKVIYEGDEILRKKAKPVKEFNEKISQLIDDMFETMAEYDGVGLAAPQVGMLRRVIVIDTGNEEDPQKYELINPEIIKTEGEVDGDEGCLSLPGKSGKVVRPEKVKVKGFDRNGQEVIVEGEGLLARALCHEIDHLEGILFIDSAREITEVE